LNSYAVRRAALFPLNGSPQLNPPPAFAVKSLAVCVDAEFEARRELRDSSRDASADVAEELEQRVAEGYEVTEAVREFIERFTGRPIGVQLLLPLREF
jgi:hypothetical protein